MSTYTPDIICKRDYICSVLDGRIFYVREIIEDFVYCVLSYNLSFAGPALDMITGRHAICRPEATPWQAACGPLYQTTHRMTNTITLLYQFSQPSIFTSIKTFEDFDRPDGLAISCFC